jgi:hypothetical protein
MPRSRGYPHRTSRGAERVTGGDSAWPCTSAPLSTVAEQVFHWRQRPARLSPDVEDDVDQIRGNTTTPLIDFGETGSLKSHEKECFL